MRIITIPINKRCPLRCGHCAARFPGTQTGDSARMSQECLDECIGALDPRTYSIVLLGGGEPSLEVPLIQFAISRSHAAKLFCAMVTAPVWAATPESAEKFLESISGIDLIIMSYDRYHLEFLKISNYENALQAAAGRNICMAFHLCCSNEQEKEELLDQLGFLRHLFQVNCTYIVPIGNAAKSVDAQMSRITVENVASLSSLPRGCRLGDIQIDEEKTVYGCCWMRAAPRSPFVLSSKLSGLKATLEQLERSAKFQAVRRRGFLDALSSTGQEAMARLARGREFLNECHLCLTAMNELGPEIWNEEIFIPAESHDR